MTSGLTIGFDVDQFMTTLPTSKQAHTAASIHFYEELIAGHSAKWPLRMVNASWTLKSPNRRKSDLIL